MLDSSNHSATLAPPLHHDRAKPKRSRARILTGVNGSTILGKRIRVLIALFSDALGGADSLTPIQRFKVAEASQLKALAERARGEYLRNGIGDLDDIIRCERKATAAERALNIVERPAPRLEEAPSMISADMTLDQAAFAYSQTLKK